MTITNRFYIILVFFSFLLSLTACGKQVRPAVCMNISDTIQLEEGIRRAENNLHSGCTTLEDCVAALIKVAKADPAVSHQEKIKEFLRSAHKNGLATKPAVAQEYNKYFGNGLRLRNNYSINARIEDNPGSLAYELKMALEYRCAGAQAIGDNEAEREAIKQYNDMLKIVEAISAAQESEGL